VERDLAIQEKLRLKILILQAQLASPDEWIATAELFILSEFFL
jgi:hypothetical protein